jgi:hypothetical protein
MHWLLGSPATRSSVPDHPDQVTAAFAAYLSQSALPIRGHRVYVDQGTETLDSAYRPYGLAFEKLMTARGWINGPAFQSLVFPGADHSEKAWNERLDIPLVFLLGTPARR